MKRFYPYILFVITGFGLYFMTFDNAFQFDTLGYVLRNPLIRDITNIPAIWKSIDPGTRFITMFTFALNYHFGLYDVFGYHLVNTVIHITNASLLYVFVLLLFRTKTINLSVPDSGKAVAFFCAIIFLVHPIQTQAVTYVVQRFASLATMFYLLSMIFFIKMRLDKKKKVFYGILLMVSALLGIFSKEIVITLPLMLLVLEITLFHQGNWREARLWFSLKYILPITAFLFILPFLFHFNVSDIIFRRVPSGSHEGDFVTFPSYLLTQLVVLPYYIRLFFYPIGQNLDYDWPVSSSIFDWKVIAGIIFLVAIFWWALKMRPKNNLVYLGIMFFFVSVSLESIIPIIHVIFEYRLYLPMIGFSLFLSAFVWQIVPEKKKYFYVLAVLTVFLSVLTVRHNLVWDNGISLWSDCVKKSPNKSRPYMNLGVAYLEAGDAEKAMDYFNKSIAIYPTAKAINNRAVVYSKKEQYDLALAIYSSIIERFPDHEEAINNRALVYQRLKQYDLALKDFKALEEGRPQFDEIYKNRAELYKEMGKIDLAIGDYGKFLQLNPARSDIFNERGILYKRLGVYDKALEDYDRALKMEKKSYLIYNNRGNVYKETGKNDLALLDYNQAIKLNSKDPVTYANRSQAYVALKKFDLALQDALTAKNLGYKGMDNFIEELKKRLP